MNLHKTIISLSNDSVHSRKLFDENVYQHAFVLLVVKGAGQRIWCTPEFGHVH